MAAVSERPSAEDLAEVYVLLDEAIGFTRADKGHVQWYDRSNQTLKIIAYRGLGHAFLSHFKQVKAYDGSAVGRAFGSGAKTIIGDVELDKGYAPHLEVARSEKFRSVISIPLISDGATLGILSFHYHEPRWNWDTEKLPPIVSSLVGLLEK
jgi:GAF domain-containing protein